MFFIMAVLAGLPRKCGTTGPCSLAHNQDFVRDLKTESFWRQWRHQMSLWSILWNFFKS